VGARSSLPVCVCVCCVCVCVGARSSLPDDVFDDISASFDFCFWGSFEPIRMSKRYGGGGGGGHRSPPDTGPRRNRMFKKRGFICNEKHAKDTAHYFQ